MQNNNKILVALDGSQKAEKTIEYLCTFKPFRKKEIVLFNVIDSVPDCYYDITKEPFSHSAVTRVKAWELGQRAKMESFMAETRMRLITSGFRSKDITIAIQNRKKGIARDILEEASKGYSALLIRRKGWASSLLPLALGGISTKLVEKGVSVPIILTGIKQINNSIMIAVDGSEGSKRAVNFLVKTIGNFECKIVLLSVVRDCETDIQYRDKEEQAIFSKIAFEEFGNAMDETKQTLADAGIKEENITTKIIEKAKSRAGAIIEASKQENCDTIIFGRKGKTDIASYGIGRVPWKVIHAYRKITAWIIP